MTSKDIYDEWGNDPKSWFFTARGLIGSARCLMKEYRENINPLKIEVYDIDCPLNHHSSSLMLYAFAIECLLKAIGIQNGNVLFVDGIYVKIVKSEKHDLVKISHAIGLKFTKDEKRVLSHISTLAVSSGRYPLTTSHKTMPINLKWNQQSDMPLLESIVDTLYNEVESKIKQYDNQ